MTKWLPVPNYPRYQISDDGQVVGPRGPLELWPDKHGRLFARPRIDGKRVRIWIAPTVCAVFNGPKPGPNYDAAHHNDVCTDNRAENLAWKTRYENMQDAIRNGRTRKGQVHTEEAKRKLSVAITGKKLGPRPQAVKDKISVAQKQRWARRNASANLLLWD